jgi:hypothetical protein
MPCYDSRSSTDYIETETRKESQAYVDKLTRMLCEAMKAVDRFSADASRRATLSYELNEWWKQHKAVDAKRRKK